LDESSSFEFRMECTDQTSLMFKIQRGKFKVGLWFELPVEDDNSFSFEFGLRFQEQGNQEA
jgi:hypothetical protein